MKEIRSKFTGSSHHYKYKKFLNNEDIITIIGMIQKHLDDGYSIGIYRRKVLGVCQQNKFYRTVILQPEYLKMLNEYLERKRCGYTFKREGLRLVKCSPKKKE